MEKNKLETQNFLIKFASKDKDKCLFNTKANSQNNEYPLRTQTKKVLLDFNSFHLPNFENTNTNLISTIHVVKNKQSSKNNEGNYLRVNISFFL